MAQEEKKEGPSAEGAASTLNSDIAASERVASLLVKPGLFVPGPVGQFAL